LHTEDESKQSQKRMGSITTGEENFNKQSENRIDLTVHKPLNNKTTKWQE
jgi:hypothetical protein